MKKWRVELSAKAVKQFKKLGAHEKRQISSAIDKLAINPLSQQTKKLNAPVDLYRIRTGHYRIIYEIESGKLKTLVLHIAHRKDVYRFLN
ncbi:MAG: type II toxin-antitoxin system mRNA interferase toxin, RelE/StbE family [Legionellaceae bacterium]|nr:type II toxin-antitoxin system mRNA interferase toxin, RelE/StbE family [Legionellaceae bacterium]|tara:strand:- start:197 stop:466 length:270 start_codon:yes stop_codon:yes gene_type:complete